MKSQIIIFGLLSLLGLTTLAHDDESSVCESLKNSVGTCSCLQEEISLICCNSQDTVTHQVCNSSQSIHEISDIFVEGPSPHFVNLTDDFFEILGVADNEILTFTVSNTGLQHVNICQEGSRWCDHLQKLDLRNNSIHKLEEPKFGSRNGLSLFLSGNQWPFATPGKGNTEGKVFFANLTKRKAVRWSYSDNKYSVDLMWLLEPKWDNKWKDMNTTWCPHVEGFSKSQLLEEMLRIVKRTFVDCPVSCTCATNIQHNKNAGEDGLEFPIKTLCIGLNLTELPAKIPISTDHLDVSNNQISSLAELKSDNYKNLQSLIIKNNKVKSIAGLLGTPLIMDNPQDVDFSHNRITSVTALNDSMSQLIKKSVIRKHRVFSFSSNPLVCTCGCIEKTQRFIFKYASTLLKDSMRWNCSQSDSTDDNMRGRLVSQIEEEECGEGIDPLVVVIILEVLLLVALLGNLYFDYVSYQRTGVLPWISVILPDWIPLPNLPNTFLSHKGDKNDKKRKTSRMESTNSSCDKNDKKRKTSRMESTNSSCDDRNERKKKKSIVSVASNTSKYKQNTCIIVD